MSDLATFRDHCRRMAAESHKLECHANIRGRWGHQEAVYPDPACTGCNSPGDRALFAALAAEIDQYLDQPAEADLFGEVGT